MSRRLKKGRYIMAKQYRFTDHILKEAYVRTTPAPTDPTCEALPFLWVMVHEETGRGLWANSLRDLSQYACSWDGFNEYTRAQLRYAAALLWHRYKADAWARKRTPR
jgi:hypothetical protein